jgi:hypothetical protein
MTPDKLAPLVGLSVGVFLAFGALAVFCLLLSALIPFTLIALRKQSQQQLDVLRRIEQRLAPPSPPGLPGITPSGAPGPQHDPANVN